VGGLHAALLWANARTPPTLDESALKALLAAFLVAVGCWALAWTLRFRRPR
jgi:hypothetical protein